MWMLIQLLVLVGSLSSFAFTLWMDNKTQGLVRAAARASAGTGVKIVLKIVVVVVIIGVFARLGWYPIAGSAFISLLSIIWAWSSPKSLEDFE